ncbi:MAG TPA: N-acetylglucosamine-6-phosphate deacetylase [bacterium]|nr:N-acetylglucosamine-6-phosphate deacetylase [bacterium]
MSSGSFSIAAAQVIAEQGTLSPGVVDVEGGRIVRVRRGRPPRAVRLHPGILAPGLIDLQINGCAGVDFATVRDAASLERVRSFLLGTGVTAYLPTLISAPPALLRERLRWWRDAARGGGGPRILGVHVEGPYLSAAFAGAHPPEHLRPPDARELAAVLDEAPGLVRLLTLAPELPGADALIDLARRRRILVSAGHTDATYDQARGAFRAGVRMVTHLFNAMRPLHHREPGIVGAALEDGRVTAGLIADLVHVHPAVLKMVIGRKGWSRVALVTDAVAAAGEEAGPGTIRTSSLAGRTVTVSDAPRLASGALAGSLLTLDQAVRNVAALGVPQREAILMASAVPAALLGRSDLGRIAPGARADLVLFDRSLRVRAVYAGGVPVRAGGGIAAHPTE